MTLDLFLKPFLIFLNESFINSPKLIILSQFWNILTTFFYNVRILKSGWEICNSSNKICTYPILLGHIYGGGNNKFKLYDKVMGITLFYGAPFLLGMNYLADKDRQCLKFIFGLRLRLIVSSRILT